MTASTRKAARCLGVSDTAIHKAERAGRIAHSMISSLTNRGTLRFMIYDGALNASIFLRFLRRLVKGAKRKLFVIVDNLRVHRARMVTAWLQPPCRLTKV